VRVERPLGDHQQLDHPLRRGAGREVEVGGEALAADRERPVVGRKQRQRPVAQVDRGDRRGRAGGGRGLDRPAAAFGTAARRAADDAGAHEAVVGAGRAQGVGERVGGPALGEGEEVELGALGEPRAAPLGVESQPVAAPGGDGGIERRAARPAGGALGEPPEPEERAAQRPDRAVAPAAEGLGALEQLERRLAQGDLAAPPGQPGERGGLPFEARRRGEGLGDRRLGGGTVEIADLDLEGGAEDAPLAAQRRGRLGGRSGVRHESE